MRRQSIFLVNRFFYPDQSATAQMLSDLAFHLAKSHRVVVITTSGLYDDPAANLASFGDCGGVEVQRVYRPLFGRDGLAGRAADYTLMYLVFGMTLLKLVRANDVVVVKTDPPLLSVALRPVIAFRRATLVNWLQDLYPEVADAFGVKALKPALPLLKILRDKSLRASRSNVVIGIRMKQWLLSLGVPENRIAVIQNWCPHDDIRPLDSSHNRLRRSWRLTERFVVGYSGNLGRAHEVETLLGAAEIMKKEKRLVFLFIGGGALLPYLRDEVVRRGLAHLFEFRPYQSNETLPASMTLADIFWVSLRPEMEGLIVPSKFYSYCAAGRPTIFIGDLNGEISRLINEAQCGVNVNVGDSRELAAAIVMLMQSPSRLETMGRHARSASETAFDKAAALNAWGALLTQTTKPQTHR